MKLKILRAAGVRGFNEPRELPFHETFTILYGPNGSGKSSVAEAIEWGLFGRISKHDYAINLDEFRGAYRNPHYVGTDLPYVEIMLADDAGTEFLVRRELVGGSDAASRLLVNGTEVGDLVCLGIDLDARYPVIAQHGLKAFLHAKGQDRWTRFARLLGLGELSAFRNVCMQAASEYDGLIASQDRKFVTDLEAKVALQPSLSTLDLGAHEFMTEPYLLATIEATTDQLFHDQCQRPLLSGLRALEKRLRDAVIPTAFLSLREWSQAELDDLSWGQAEFVERATNLKLEAVDFISTPGRALEKRRQDFLERGLSLLDEQGDPHSCPFCGEQTISDTVLTHVREAIESAKAITVGDEAGRIAGQVDSLMARVKKCMTTLQVRTQPIVDDGPTALERVEKLGQDSPFAPLKQQIEQFSKIDAARDIALNEFESDCAELASCVRRVQSPEGAKEVWTASVSRAAKVITEEKEQIESFKRTAGDWQRQLDQLAADDGEVRAASTLRELAETSKRFAVARSQLAIERRMSTLREEVTAFEETETENRLRKRADDVLEWYSRLSPSSEVSFDGLDLSSKRQRTVVVKASSYGKQISASASLNECRENCIGLSIYLSQCLDSRTPFKFVVIDDPVQSMDEAHRDTLFFEVLRDILDRGIQVVYVTHLNNDAQDLANCYRTCDPDRWEFKAYSKEGPSFDFVVGDVAVTLKTASEKRHGNATDRRSGANLVRQGIEHLVKETYRRTTRQPLSYKYRRLDKKATIELAYKSKVYTEDEITTIEQLYSKASTKGHTDPETEPPTPEELESMIHRVKKLAQSKDVPT